MSVQEPSAEVYSIANTSIDTVSRFVQHITDPRHLNALTAVAVQQYGTEGREYDTETIAGVHTVIVRALERTEYLIATMHRFDAFVVASPLLEFFLDVAGYIPAAVIPLSDRPTAQVVEAYYQIGKYRYGQELVVVTVGDTLRGYLI